MRFHQSAVAVVTALALLAGLGTASAAADPSPRISVYDYAVQNPVDDSPLPVPPSLGETVPRTVSLVPLGEESGGEESGYAYFYYDGRPVIVDVNTRSVVRLGQ